MDERTARMGLCALMHMGAPKLAELVHEEGAVWVWEALLAKGEDSMWGRRAKGVDLPRIQELAAGVEARFLIPGDEEWPSRLDDLHGRAVSGQGGAPFGLWVRGAPIPDGGVAVVGARAATQYGQTAAMDLSADLASRGAPVVSGLAYGIDAAAHRGALTGAGPDAVGATVAVVAGGIDKPYPSSNAGLAAMICRQGTLVSEAPPGAAPLRPSFLARNRLIAALSDGVLLIEAALRSGAKNTAAWGNELGRVVMALPGPVTSALTATPHRLIREGQAVLVTDVRDILELLRPFGTVEEEASRGEDTALDRLPEDLRALREAIGAREELTAGTLATRTGMPIAVCLSGLQELADRGWVEAGDYGGWRLPRRRRE